ncbi:hypothetical protein [Mesorhizobium sp. RMAD-H1]|uniref:hypothetical protein n=1 Tax=Mesorhizobium sp. RMAD-H1 TaxID=2587065 RepID=UPI001609EF8D|nr:hypothetical protein [Mesorhizobium sp. RMAD-H1]MBB2974186.1 hypothetical protein [Mesorhizobium sp. RMAD-H1]
MSRISYIAQQPDVAKNITVDNIDNPPIDCLIRLTAVATQDAKPGDTVTWKKVLGAGDDTIYFYPASGIPKDKRAVQPSPYTMDTGESTLGDNLMSSIYVASADPCIVTISAELGTGTGQTYTSVVLCTVDPSKSDSDLPAIGMSDTSVPMVKGGQEDVPSQTYPFDAYVNVAKGVTANYAVLLATGADPVTGNPPVFPPYRLLQPLAQIGGEAGQTVEFEVPYSECEVGSSSKTDVAYFICDEFGRTYLSPVDGPVKVTGYPVSQPNPNNPQTLPAPIQIQPQTQYGDDSYNSAYPNGTLLDEPNDPITNNDFDQSKNVLYFAIPDYGYKPEDQIFVYYYFNGWHEKQSLGAHFGPPIASGPWPATRFTNGFGNTANKGNSDNFLKVNVPKSKVLDYEVEPGVDNGFGYLWVQYKVLTGAPSDKNKDANTSEVYYSMPLFTHCLID